MRSTNLLLLFCLSVLTAVFPGEPGLARFIGDKEVEAVVTTGAVRRTKLQSNHHHRQTKFYRPDALAVAEPTVSKH